MYLSEIMKVAFIDGLKNIVLAKDKSHLQHIKYSMLCCCRQMYLTQAPPPKNDLFLVAGRLAKILDLKILAFNHPGIPMIEDISKKIIQGVPSLWVTLTQGKWSRGGKN